MTDVSTFSPKGITAGALAFIVLATVVFFATNLSESALSVPVIFILWAFAWIAPGYATAYFSSANNLINSATAGALVGIAAGTTLLVFIDQSVNLPVSKTALLFGSVCGAATLFCLGGLLWVVTSRRRVG